ncbi:uncharacterized protein M437DRAFT_15446, partial [Aureobasidium melanogenum CBS 110374]
ECYFCDREFNSWNALRQHKDTLEHWECETCDQLFGSQYTANAHMTSLYHWGTAVECDKCDRTFNTWKACKRHMTKFGHWFTDVCDTCDRRFVDRIAVEQHMLAVGHKAQHRSQITNCPFCRLGFYAVSKILQHLEATSCRARPDLNRGNIYHHIHGYDTGAYITESFSDSNVSVPENEESLYHCPSMTGKCQGKRLRSFAALYAHLES